MSLKRRGFSSEIFLTTLSEYSGAVSRQSGFISTLAAAEQALHDHPEQQSPPLPQSASQRTTTRFSQEGKDNGETAAIIFSHVSDRNDNLVFKPQKVLEL